MSDYNKAVIKEFRENEGKVGGPHENRDLLLLHTTGAKSGQERINPVVYTKDGERFVVIASKGGAPTHPDWYYNLLAHPKISIEVGTDEMPVKAIVAEEPERTELYDKMAAKYGFFAEYAQQTKRVIPVVILDPI
jgi:deazaflavin-dependent oxidoreductase (nitroreductase family)